MTENKKNKEISRRKFVAGASLVIGGAGVGAPLVRGAGEAVTAEAAAVSSQESAKAKSPAEYEVVSPEGMSITKMIAMAPRLDTLEGKTIGFATNRLFKYEVTFPAIEKVLLEKYPTAKIVPHTEFHSIRTNEMAANVRIKVVDDLGAEFLEKGCDAVITGNGG